VPIVPVAQEGFFEAWPRGRSFQRFTPLQISIGDPVYPNPAEAPEAAYNRLTAEVHERVVSMWEALHARGASPSPVNLHGSSNTAEKHRAMHS